MIPASHRSSNTTPKPKILYISQDYSKILVPNNLEPIVYRIDNWLSHFFEVVQIRHDCSLAREIELHHPDMVLFDGFIEGLHETAPKVTDHNTNPEIPKAGFCRVDSLSPTRACLFEFYERVGVEAIFVLGDTTMGNCYPALADRIIYVPQFIDPNVYRDYGLYKSIPVSLVGNFDDPQYPWRKSVKEELLNRFPTTYFRHPGYSVDGLKKNPIIIYGEDFAKTINSSLITPTSGGFKKIAVSKHVEIPGARSCLVSDYTMHVGIYGFENMKSCVFADAAEAPDAVDFLLRNRDTLENITQTGFEFVHSRHTLMQRDQICNWLELRQRKTSAQKIIQPDLFGPLQLVDQHESRATLHLTGGLDEELITEGDQALWSGDLDTAEARYEGAKALCEYMAEPHLRLGIVKMLKGDARAGMKMIWHNIEWYNRNGKKEGDPLDLAYALISLLCVGFANKALLSTRLFANIRRIELDRARWAVLASMGRLEELFDLTSLEVSPDPQVASIHTLKCFTFEEQIDLFIQMLISNNQLQLAGNLSIVKTQEVARRMRLLEQTPVTAAS